MKIIVRPRNRAPYTVTLGKLTALVRAARTLKAMGRLADKLARANDAIAGLEIAVDHDVDAIIERTKEVHKTRENVMLRKHMSLDGQMSDLKEFAADLEAFGKNDRSGVGGSSNGSAYEGTTPKKPAA